MTLIEIAQEARPGELFKHDADDAECYFDEYGVLQSHDEDGEYGFVPTQEEIVSNKWHFVW